MRGWEGASALNLLLGFFFTVLFPPRPSAPPPSPSREGWDWAYRVTVETPSTNLVLKRTLALLNMPSFRDTTMNWECLKCALSIWPMFCVWDRSRAASTSSRIIQRSWFKQQHRKDKRQSDQRPGKKKKSENMDYIRAQRETNAFKIAFTWMTTKYVVYDQTT